MGIRFFCFFILIYLNFCFTERGILHVVLLVIYIFLLVVDLISKLYIVYIHYFGMCFVSAIYIFLLVDLLSKLYTLFVVCFVYIHFIIRLLLSLSVLINQLYTFLHVSVTHPGALSRRDSLLLDACSTN